MKRLLCLLSFIPFISTNLRAQTSQDQNDVVFKKLVSLIDQKMADSIYNMLSDDFQSKLSRPVFTGFLNINIFVLGSTNGSASLSRKGNISSYKLSFAEASFEVVVGTDTKSRITGLTFKPYSDPLTIKRKNYSIPTSNKLNTPFDKAIDSIALKYISMENTTGLCIGVWKAGQSFIYNYGETAKGNKNLPDSYTLFEIGSITKTFTATLLAYYSLVHKISLQDPITKYLPDSVASNKSLAGITVEMLSNHTSGLPSVPANIYQGNADDRLNPYKMYSRHLLFSYLKQCTPDAKPGEQYAYSNLAVGLLGVILEGVSGQPYEQMVKTVICKPLGMMNTVQHITPTLEKEVVAVYDRQGQQVSLWDFDALAAAGCLKSSMHDMLLYAKANMHDAKEEPYKAMQLTHIVTTEKILRVGLGWHYTRDKESHTIWHNGGTGGSSSFLAFNADKNIAVVVLSNCEETVDDAGKELLDLAFQ